MKQKQPKTTSQVVGAAQLIRRYAAAEHEENGLFIERHYPSSEQDPASGSIYYYLAPGEKSLFHRLEFDEYWIFNAGTTLDIWIIDAEGNLTVKRCGTDEDAEPMVFMPAGCTFAARHSSPDLPDGTFVTCITVPRFKYSGSTLLLEEEVVELCPAAKAFFEQ